MYNFPSFSESTRTISVGLINNSSSTLLTLGNIVPLTQNRGQDDSQSFPKGCNSFHWEGIFLSNLTTIATIGGAQDTEGQTTMHRLKPLPAYLQQRYSGWKATTYAE
ncbi:MAG: hypothetical protein ABJ139_05905, partial [Paracoccaceae bacterium]